MSVWRRLILFAAIVLLPAIVVGIGNYKAFPDSFWLATFMLLTTVVVSGVFTWKSKDATQKVQRYCLIADIVICAILCINVGCHWVFSREVSGAKQATIERRAEEDRAEQRRAAEAQRQIELAKAEAERAKAEANAAYQESRRLAQLPPSQRRARVAARRAAPVSQPEAPPALPPMPTATATAPRLTLEQVYENWWWILTALAFAETFASVLAGAILMAVWEWDRDHDGVADHLQGRQGRGVTVSPRQAGFVQAQTERDPKAESNQD